MKCPDCGAEMKPLATSVYCPNDCDRKVQEVIDPERTEKIIWPEGTGPLSFISIDEDLDWTDTWGDVWNDSTD